MAEEEGLQLVLCMFQDSGDAFRVLCAEGACGKPDEAVEGTPSGQTLSGKLQCLQVLCCSEKL